MSGTGRARTITSGFALLSVSAEELGRDQFNRMPDGLIVAANLPDLIDLPPESDRRRPSGTSNLQRNGF